MVVVITQCLLVMHSYHNVVAYVYLYLYLIVGILAYLSGDVCKSEDHRIRMTVLIRTKWLTVV